MKVILSEDIKSIGKKGEVVEVADGYGRNFLLKNKKAVLATSGAVKEVKVFKEKQNEKDALKLQEAKEDSALYLSQKELLEWFKAFEEDLINNKILFKDYVLFYTTFFLGDRKSESYALQWKHIDFDNRQIQLVQALDKYKTTEETPPTVA